MGDVVRFPKVSARSPVPAALMVDAELGQLDHVIVIGLRKDGTPHYASTTTDAAWMNLMVDRFKLSLVDG